MKRILILILIISYYSTILSQSKIDSVKMTNAYDSIVSIADSLFVNEKFEESGAQYFIAGKIIPTQYVITQIDNINQELTNRTPSCGGGQYKKIVDKANELYEAKDYENAKKLYQRALDIYPSDPQADFFKERLTELNKIITEANKD